MNGLEKHRREATEYRMKYENGIDPRKVKRYEASHLDPVHWAYVEGSDAGYFNYGNRNPYPPGRRHDEYNRGYEISKDEA
ncbi:hypothetical protein EVB32_163 [Rhizobium phage RHph_TM39]|uniref:Uncharacterized protein n=1 Tax=Rhizobium phage RHph_TM30 TaxID=2509764 RepID=A0A7S5R553_9CAUD|nr:hypothetical protein PQC16_gp163 [Rhizobium phage RHph_TM30]QIG71632.1 hypothetical protein EVB94_161 [Rhizobium phage RHph_TM40]QIG71996.1 hypothetical protein EVB95_162 [Rhizobium phage RHph_TM2_3B]QIG72359.1 hypothetical protein EVB96_163 [Rhizobium phage RHph_TM3_3_6]QIG77151.1 hypothetical protein EVB32_163 [Rhizobium phage RHph_TM39]QIG77485.1 hypothetical protein EVB61_157 [Rhizobium phage RHph_TM21B]QIG77747.1 hypothetical protein EVB64_160 [Rhizobium phage RHph_TM61]